MPVQAIKDWLSYFEDIADAVGVDVEITPNDIFQIRAGRDPPAVGKVRASEYPNRKEDHIWQRFNREQERLAEDRDERVFSVQLDVETTDRFDPAHDHFILVTQKIIETELTQNGDVHIDTDTPGIYDAPFNGHADNWNALFEYTTGEGADENLSEYVEADTPTDEIDEQQLNVVEADVSKEGVSDTAPYYWVNQGEEEIEGEYLRAPVKERFQYDLPKLEAGDIVFSYSDGVVRGYHEVTGPLRIVELPAEGVKSGSQDEGAVDRYRLETEFTTFNTPLDFADVFPKLWEARLDKYYPVNPGGINQQYLFNLSEEAGEYLMREGMARDRRYFWVNSNDERWPDNGEEKFYRRHTRAGNPRTKKEAFERVREGDEVIIYRTTPSRKIVGQGRVVQGLHEEQREDAEEPVDGITIVGEQTIDGPEWADLAEESELQQATPITSDNSILLAELDEDEYESILSMAGDPKRDIEELRSRLSLPQLSIPLPDTLYFDEPDELRRQIEASLNSGKHIIFTGPPGTGKTKLAKEVADYCATEYPAAVDDYRFTTATSAWTTFDTIGGYVPQNNVDGDELVFQPRIFLNCFREEEIRNDWLVIDEINRSDIDKAFGQLFSVLSGDSVELPYERESPVEVASLSPGESEQRLKEVVRNEDVFPVTPSWRLLATMNTYDKASLYELSYAFMRRFNFIHIGVPELKNGNGEIRTSLLNPDADDNYATRWIESDPELEATLEDVYCELAVIWWKVNNARMIGPSLVQDMVSYVAANAERSEPGDLLTDAIIALVYPQLEGMRPQEQRQLIDSLNEVNVATEANGVDLRLDQERLRKKAADFFNIDFEDDD